MNKDDNMIGSKLATCDVCGNTYDKCFEVRMGGEMHVFDSFECAIHALAPTAVAGLLDTAWRRRMLCIAAFTVPASMASISWKTE